MSGDGRGVFVTVLRAGNKHAGQVPVRDPASAAPLLDQGMDADQRDVLWIRGLQAMFNDDDPEVFPQQPITGEYDRRTADRVRRSRARAPAR